MPRIWMLISIVLFVKLLFAQENPRPDIEVPLSPERVAELNGEFEKGVRESSDLIRNNLNATSAYLRRGDALFFKGRFDEAVADYDKSIELDGTLRQSHWQRGIALFYSGRYEAAAAQFDSYHSFDNVDRENGIWRYLSQSQAEGRDKARLGLLKYQKDDREPFPAVYELFGGTTTPDQILKRIAAADISNAEREKRRFYARLYIGLNDAVEGREVEAREHLASATRNAWAPSAGYGPSFMWNVARLHEQILREKIKKLPKTAISQ